MSNRQAWASGTGLVPAMARNATGLGSFLRFPRHVLGVAGFLGLGAGLAACGSSPSAIEIDMGPDGRGTDTEADLSPDANARLETSEDAADSAFAELGLLETTGDIGRSPDLSGDRGDGADAGPEPGTFGWPCVEAGDCISGFCIQTSDGKVCTETCVEECPADWQCVPAGTGPDIFSLCIPQFVTLCRPCRLNSDCWTSGFDAGARCVPHGPAGSFCGAGCGKTSCPAGYQCAEVLDAGGEPVSQCVLEEGDCACAQLYVDQGATTDCSVENGDGTCHGERMCTASGLSACDALVPAPDTCNGLDDDCDGATDEDLGQTTCGIGNCLHSQVNCIDGIVQLCDPFEGQQPEECDGQDNDCNGEKDDFFPDLDQDFQADCVDPDDDGDGVGDDGDNCPGKLNPKQEDADGDLVGDACDPDADGDAIPDAGDNCLGLKNTLQSDIDADGLGDACDPDQDDDAWLNEDDNCPLVANPKQTDTDGDGIGDACAKDKDGDGVDDQFDCAPLNPAIHPGADEGCDGVDNDCDAAVDEGFPDTDADGLKDCIDPDDDDDGSPDDADCAPLDPDMAPGLAELCDAKDNDCNGLPDDGVGTLACGKGICFHTMPACINGTLQTCDPFSGAILEQCDGVDNDCDGLEDEDLGWELCGLGACQHLLYVCDGGQAAVCDPFDGAAPEKCDGQDNDCDGQIDEELGSTTCGQGECMHTGPKCQGGVPQACDPKLGAKPEACDGLDNDCDGETDEGLGATNCGQGNCFHTVPNCQDGTPQICNPLQGAQKETCDGTDNDCNGKTDEELGVTTCGKGVCENVVVNCVAGVPQECDPWLGKGDEVCDGKDNDCDGETDEGLGDTTCGKGLCEHTVPNCKGGVVQECDPWLGKGDEVCDGKDNDCDGETDEGLGQTTCGIGPCLHTTPNCLGGLPQACNPFQGAQEEGCDGADNDCDGETDEGCPGASCLALHLADPLLPSGTYSIDPDGPGGDPPFAAQCDMVTEGGGWTTAFDDTGTWQVTQAIPAGVLKMACSELLLYSASGGPAVQPLAPPLASLAAAFAQGWQACGFEDDYYKALGAYAGTHTTTAYIFDDHDIAGGAHYSCSGHQKAYPTTPNGFISFGYANGNNFGDGGTCDYDQYPGVPIRKVLVR